MVIIKNSVYTYDRQLLNYALSNEQEVKRVIGHEPDKDMGI